MKKLLFLLSFIFIIGMTGCKDKNPGDTAENSTTEQVQIEPVTTILDERQPLDDQGILSYISNAYIEDGIQQQIYNYQENLLICSSLYDGVNGTTKVTLELISTQSGELLSKMEKEYEDTPVLQILDRHIVVSDRIAGKIEILKEDLTVEKEYELEQGLLFLNRMMTKAYVINQEPGILVINLEDKSQERVMKEMENVYTSKICGDNVTLVYTDRKTGLSNNALLNLATEEVEILDLNKSLYGVEHNSRVWLAGLIGETSQYFYGTEEVPKRLKLQTDVMPSFLPNSDELILSQSQEDGSLNLTAYNPDGSYLSKISIPGGSLGYWGMIVKFESLHGYLLTSIDEQGVDRLYHWDTSLVTEGTNLEFLEMADEVPKGDALPDELYEKAKLIGEKYGITIKIADQCDVEYDGYTVEQNLNPDKISRGLDTIDLSLSSYPDGFIEQLYFGYFREIEINLMGNIYAINQVEENKSGFDSFIAFVQNDEDKYTMVFDLSRGQLIEQDLYHEFSHVIDKKMQHMVDQGKELFYSEEQWASLNPEGFVYTGSYTDVPDAYYYDGYDDYFIDIYSRTFPSEDRARIMEYAMMGAQFCFDTYPGLVMKLEYYSECIRDCFDTTGWPEVTKWEEMLLLVD